jgi:type VII secretion integral membrane protein EccD
VSEGGSRGTGGQRRVARVTGLSRVTVTYAGRAVDVTVPSDIPIASFLGELAWTCGVRLDSEQPVPLHLSRPVSGVIQPASTLAQAGVVDGDLLVLAEEPVEAPRVVDDLGRAVSAAVERLPGRWSRRATMAALRLATVLAIGGGAALLALGWQRAGRPGPLPPAVAAAGLVGLAASAGRAATTAGIRWPLLLAAVPWGALAGAAFTDAGGGGLARGNGLAAAGTGALVVALTGAVADREQAPPALALAAVAGTVAAGAAAIAAGRSAEQAGSVLAVAALAGLLLLPRVVVRASGLPRLGDGSSDREVGGRVGGARRLLAWLLAGLSGSFLIAAGLLASSPGPAGHALALVAAAAVGLRARTYRFVAEAAPLLLAAGLALGGTLAAVVTAAAGPLAAAGLAVAVGLGLAGATTAVARARERGRGHGPDPAAGKAVEMVELACLVAAVPLATVSSGALAALVTAAKSLVGGS